MKKESLLALATQLPMTSEPLVWLQQLQHLLTDLLGDVDHVSVGLNLSYPVGAAHSNRSDCVYAGTHLEMVSMSVTAIAQSLSLSDHTVRRHQRSIRSKLSIRSQLDLLRPALTGASME
jgi:cytidine deaminase